MSSAYCDTLIDETDQKYDGGTIGTHIDRVVHLGLCLLDTRSQFLRLFAALSISTLVLACVRLFRFCLFTLLCHFTLNLRRLLVNCVGCLFLRRVQPSGDNAQHNLLARL